MLLVFKHYGTLSSDKDGKNEGLEKTEYTDADVEKLMKELDDTIDGVLDEMKELKETDDAATKEEEKPVPPVPEKDPGEGNEDQAVKEDSEEKRVEPQPGLLSVQPSTTESGTAETKLGTPTLSPAKPEPGSIPAPALPPRLAPGPPLPPRTHSRTSSLASNPPTSNTLAKEIHGDMVSNLDVVVDRIYRRNPQAIKGWSPYLSAVYMNTVGVVAFAGWLNIPLSVEILNENGIVVSQQTTKQTENYIVFVGSRSATVLLLLPQKPPQLVAERSFVGAVQGPLGNYIISRKPQTPGSYIIQAGVAVLRSGPVVLTVTRDGTMNGYGLPSLEHLFESPHPEHAGEKHNGTSRSTPLSTIGGWGLGPLRVKVLQDGRVCCWTGEKEIKKMNERGERLQQLEGKFSALSDSSKSMVDALKEYNARQEQKKWWQL
ncbi:hypothetical protein HDU96_010043 [Phlyctochytrium bullatum]|nr:hypothetical protein HDU96_010043 [Phlyctochytrium bullatum]